MRTNVLPEGIVRCECRKSGSVELGCDVDGGNGRIKLQLTPQNATKSKVYAGTDMPDFT